MSDSTAAGSGKKPFDRVAIASLVLSVLWIYGLGSLLGAVLGAIALNRFPADPAASTRRGRTFASIGFMLGVIGVFVTLIAIVWLAQAVNDTDFVGP